MQLNNPKAGKVAIAFVSAIVLMVAALTLIISSPWYSEYFNQTLKEDAFEVYRQSKGIKDPAAEAFAAEQLAAILRTTGIPSSVIELHVQEELARHALRHQTDPQRYLQDLQGAMDLHRDELLPVVQNKLMRSLIVAAQDAVRRKDLKSARSLTNTAFNLLRSQSLVTLYCPQRSFVDSLLALSASIELQEGNKAQAESAEADRLALADPEAARKLFAANGLQGYETSYPGQYAVMFAIRQMNGNRTPVPVLLRLLKAADSSSVTPSTKLVVLRMVVANRLHNQNKELARHILDFWLKNYGSQELAEERIADTAWHVYQLVYVGTTAAELNTLHNQIVGAIQKKYLPNHLSQIFIDNYQLPRYTNHQWPLPTVDAAQKELPQVRELLSLAERDHLDDTAIRVTLIETLLAANRFNEAHAQIVRLASEANRFTSNRTHQFILATAVIEYGKGLQRTDTPKARALTIEFLSEQLKHHYWQPKIKARLLRELAFEYDNTERKAEAQQLISQADALDPPTPDNIAGDEMRILDRFLETGKLEEGHAYYKKLQTKYASGPMSLDGLSRMFLGHWRAFPIYGKNNKRHGDKAHYPEIVFRDAERLTKAQGTQSSDYQAVLLWLAQYELCRKNMTAARELSRQAADLGQKNPSSVTLAAMDMAAELQNKPINWPKTIQAKRGTKEELRCLGSLYYQLGSRRAAARAEKLRAAVKED